MFISSTRITAFKGEINLFIDTYFAELTRAILFLGCFYAKGA